MEIPFSDLKLEEIYSMVGHRRVVNTTSRFHGKVPGLFGLGPRPQSRRSNLNSRGTGGNHKGRRDLQPRAEDVERISHLQDPMGSQNESELDDDVSSDSLPISALKKSVNYHTLLVKELKLKAEADKLTHESTFKDVTKHIAVEQEREKAALLLEKIRLTNAIKTEEIKMKSDKLQEERTAFDGFSSTRLDINRMKIETAHLAAERELKDAQHDQRWHDKKVAVSAAELEAKQLELLSKCNTLRSEIQGASYSAEHANNFVFAFPCLKASIHPEPIVLHYGATTTGSFEVNGLNFDLMDCKGSPFCGLTAVDVAAGVPPNIRNYVKSMRDPEDLGHEGNLAEYAASRGFNLAIYDSSNGRSGQVEPERTYYNVPGAKWIFLMWRDHHWLLVTGRKASLPIIDVTGRIEQFDEIVDISDEGDWWNFLSKSWAAVCGPNLKMLRRHRVLGYERNDTNENLGLLRDQREHNDSQDLYAIIETTTIYVSVRSLGRETIVSDDAPEDPFLHGTVTQRKISVMSYIEAKETVEHGLGCGISAPVSVAKAGLQMRARFLNTRMGEGILCDTAEWLSIMFATGTYRQLPSEGPTLFWRKVPARKPRAAVDTTNLECFNAPTNNSFIPNLAEIHANQLSGMGGKNSNYFLGVPKEGESKVGCVVATAPLGVIMTADGPLTPGFIPLSDSNGVIAAAAGRNMKDEVVEQVTEFVSFGEEIMDWLLPTIPRLPPEPDAREFWASHSKGKKSAAFIVQTLALYDKVVVERQGRVMDELHSMFVKLENSLKVVEGEYLVRPRLIAVQCVKSLIESSPILIMLEAINHSYFKNFHIKDTTPEKMAAKVLEICDGQHMVTDITSWELFVSYLIQKIPHRLYKRLAKREGYLRTMKAYDELNSIGSKKEFSRLLNRGGVKFFLQSRKSGDYVTSAENGLLNFCVSAYAMHKETGLCVDQIMRQIKMIAEGDDGVLSIRAFRPNIGLIESLGCRLSQNVAGTRPGDTDFLRNMWTEQGRILNVGRSLRVLWVIARNVGSLRDGKKLGLLRAKALSLHNSHPNHPILCALIVYIGKMTSGISTRFKGRNRYLDTWKGEHLLIEALPTHHKNKSGTKVNKNKIKKTVTPCDVILGLGSDHMDTRSGPVNNTRTLESDSIHTMSGFNNISTQHSLSGQQLKVVRYPRTCEVSDEDRFWVSQGCTDFPGIPIPVQIFLEERFARGEFYIGNLLDDCSEVSDLVKAGLPSDHKGTDSESFGQLKSMMGFA
jgi:hypothetical protein